MTLKTQGWTDSQLLLSLILLNLSGGDCVDDIERLQNDEGLTTLLLKIETHGMRRSARRADERRWRRSKQRAFPSPSAIHRYLEQFHHHAEEAKRMEGRAFIPAPNPALQSLLTLNKTLLSFAQHHHPCTTATLDQDATIRNPQTECAVRLSKI